MDEYKPVIYRDREYARGPSLNIGNFLDLKEQRGVGKEEVVKQASKRIRKIDTKDDFIKILVLVSGNNNQDNETIFDNLANNIPHFEQLNMPMLAAARYIWEDLKFPDNDDNDDMMMIL